MKEILTMLPIDTWLAAMTVESHLPTRPPINNNHAASARLMRRAVGRGLIALGKAVAGNETVAPRTVGVGR